MSTTYDDLVTNIKSYSARTDSATLAAIPQFIAAAQTMLDNELRVGEMITTVTHPADTITVDASDFLAIESITIAGLVGTTTTYADITGLRHMLNLRPETCGYDFHYAMNGNAIELVKPGEVAITGYQKPPRLSSTTQTNAYTAGAENALLWLALGYLCTFVRDIDGAQSWSQMASNEVGNLNNSREEFLRTGTAGVKRRGYF